MGERRRYRRSTMSDCLALRGISKSYSAGIRGCSATVHVLRDLDLDLSCSEIVAVRAAPAAGKTTLLMCAAGLLRPDRGTVSWFAGPPRRDAATPVGIAYVSDRPFPYAFLSVREAVEYAAIVRDLPLADHHSRVSEALELTNLAAVAHRRVDALVGPQLARLALASALLARPRLLVVDDVGSGCDAAAARDLVALLRLSAEGGAGVLVAGRLVPWIAADDGGFRARVATRFVSLVDGHVESHAEAAIGDIRGRNSPVQPARVAEWTPPSGAQQNEAR